MERVAIDYIESLQKDRNGNDMIIVIIDCFSRFIILYPVQSTKSFIFAEVFLKWIGTFGSFERDTIRPRIAIHDKHREYKDNRRFEARKRNRGEGEQRGYEVYQKHCIR